MDTTTDTSIPEDIALLRQSVKLPCGKVVPNRLVKVSLAKVWTVAKRQPDP